MLVAVQQIPTNSRIVNLKRKGIPAYGYLYHIGFKAAQSHYLNRYITFIRQCQLKNVGYYGFTEGHHICPKANDMFPEYIDFSKHPWNKASLKPRQHVIAHQILSKAFPSFYSVIFSYWAMSHMNGEKINTRLYESVKIKIRQLQRENNLQRMKEGNHPFCDADGNHIINKRRVENGTHHWLGPESNNKRLKDGSHNWLRENSKAVEMIKEWDTLCPNQRTC